MSDFLPEEFKNRMKEILADEYDAFEKSYENERYRALRVNPLKRNINGKSASEDYPEKNSLAPVKWASNGYYYDEGSRPGMHPLHEAGVYYIQEPSAMLPAELLEAKPGERILDLCAAPGGKSTQIAAHMRGQGLLVSNEINPSRARILSENIERMGIKNAVVINESPASLVNRFESFFDRIMVDAPCSGEGMFRKNEEAVNEWSPENVSACAERQAQILDCAAAMLRSGGRLVYSTCTFAPEENEDGIKNFLHRNPDFTLISQRRLWPHKVKGEGHFAAVLVKKGPGEVMTDADKNGTSADEENLSNIQIPTPASDLKKIKTCLDGILKDEAFTEGGFFGYGKLMDFGQSIYLLPSGTPALSGIKVLRPGLCLGTLKKDRFEPAHSLALAIDPALALKTENLDEKESADYIKGLTKPTDVQPGWTLVCTEGYSLGWGKSAGGTLKNHYPKGLRKG